MLTTLFSQWWGLGILSLAQVTPARPFPEHLTETEVNERMTALQQLARRSLPVGVGADVQTKRFQSVDGRLS